jgi:hypothetical protein
MALEKKVNQYGQEQIIDNFDKIIKIDGKFIQVRLIKTEKWKTRFQANREFTKPMPRAKFINPSEDFYYLVSKKDLTELKKGSKYEPKRKG